MSGLADRNGRGKSCVKVAAVLIALAALAGCTGSERLGGSQPQAAAEPEPPPPPAPSQPPPVDLGGRWKLSAAAGGGCLMTLGDAAGAAQGTIAPAGGCPGNFFTSRKWTFERNMLIIHDHKGATLAQLSYAGGHFEGQDANGATLSLSR
jgi:hypothetical protein